MAVVARLAPSVWEMAWYHSISFHPAPFPFQTANRDTAREHRPSHKPPRTHRGPFIACFAQFSVLPCMIP